MSLEFRLGHEIAEKVEKEGMAVFRDTTNNQPYGLFKLKDEEGAVASFSEKSSMYLVTTIKNKGDKE